MENRDHQAGSDWEFLWGKRQWRRLDTDMMVSLRLQALEIPAFLVNLSAGGVLLRVPAPMVRNHLVASDDMPDLFALQRAFERALYVRLGPDDVERRAQGVRLDWKAEEQDSIYFGCRFDKPLTEREVERLGLDPRVLMAEAGRALPLIEDMAWQIRDDVGAAMELRRADKHVWYRGGLVAMHGLDLVTRIEGEEPTGLVAELAHERLELAVLADGEVVWTTPAWLLGVRPQGEDTLEVVVQGEETPEPIVQALFRVRSRQTDAGDVPEHQSGAA